MTRLRMLGGLSLDGPASVGGGPSTSLRRLALLAAIGAKRDGITRASLLTIFWPESSEEKARNALNQALFVLRRDLPEGALLVGTHEIRLNPSLIVSDVIEFEDAVSRGSHLEAVHLYQGPFLDGVHIRAAAEFDRWRDAAATRLARSCMESLERLANTAEEMDDPLSAVGWWQRLAAMDPASSRVALRLMQALVAAGDPTAAMRHARIHEMLVREEFGTEPDQRVLEFADRVRDGTIRPAPVAISPSRGEPETTAAPPTDASTASPTGSPRRWRLATAAGVVSLAAVLAALTFRRSADVGQELRSVAVLPFQVRDVAPDSTPSYIVDGVTEGVRDALARLDGLRVIARASSFQVRDPVTDPVTIAAQLGVTHLIAGSLSSAGSRISARVRLLEASTGRILWSEQFTREHTELLALETQIAGALARVFGLHAASPAVDTPPDGAAHAQYLQGLHLFNLRRPEDLQRALEFFSRAASTDITWALPHAMIAQTHLLLAPGSRRGVDHAMRAETAARHALALGERVPAAHLALGAARQAQGDLVEAEVAYRRALQLDPSNALARSWYGFLLLYTGRNADGLRELELAHQLDPLSIGVAANHAWGLYFTRDFEPALAGFRAILTTDSLLFAIHNATGRVLQHLGRLDEAIAAYRRAVDLGGTAQGKAFLAHALARSGRLEEALALRSELLAGRTPDPHLVAIVDVGLGDLEAALTRLEKTVAQEPYGLYHLTVDPIYDPLRPDPRFRRLIHRLTTPDRR